MNKWRVYRGDHDGHCTYQCLKCKGYIRATEAVKYDNWKFCPLCGTQWESEHKWEKPYYNIKRSFTNYFQLQYRTYIDWEFIGGEPSQHETHWQNGSQIPDRKDALIRAKYLLEDYKSDFKGSVVEVRIMFVTEKGTIPTGIKYKYRTEQ